MGYEVHVTRKAHWSDEDGARISAAEWASLLDGDPLEPADADRMTGWWTRHSGGKQDAPILLFSDGNIDAAPHDEETALFLLGLATELGAGLQGDEGEPWTTATIAATYANLDEAAPPPAAPLGAWLLLAGIGLTCTVYLARRAARPR